MPEPMVRIEGDKVTVDEDNFALPVHVGLAGRILDTGGRWVLESELAAIINALHARVRELDLLANEKADNEIQLRGAVRDADCGIDPYATDATETAVRCIQKLNAALAETSQLHASALEEVERLRGDAEAFRMLAGRIEEGESFYFTHRDGVFTEWSINHVDADFEGKAPTLAEAVRAAGEGSK